MEICDEKPNKLKLKIFKEAKLHVQQLATRILSQVKLKKESEASNLALVIWLTE